MAKILAISSQVVYGPVGLNAIVPALQAEGHEVLALPTVLLSNHPGHGAPTGGTIQIQPYIEALESLGAFKNLDAVITGYFANAQQVQQAADLIERLKPGVILIDPVIGDQGKLYVSESVALAIRDKLVPLATILTPNAFELSWLTGRNADSIEAAIVAARSLKIPEVIATSLPDGAYLATLLITATDVITSKHIKRETAPNGTGDFLSGLYLARQFDRASNIALNDSMKILHCAIDLSGNTRILAVAQALYDQSFYGKDKPHD